MLLKRLFKIFTSLRLTVVLLAFAIVLVWIGTVAQADEGDYNAQVRYFRQWVVLGVSLFGHKLPLILPGGYLIGTLLVFNLVAAHIHRFQWTVKKLGIHVAHSGIILLLVGQLATDLFSHETQIHFSEGETKKYSESATRYELVFTADAGQDSNEEIVIPARVLAHQSEVTNAALPFIVRVKEFWRNTEAPSFRAPMMSNSPAFTTNGLAAQFDFRSAAESTRPDSINAPSAVLELIGPHGSIGDWVVSSWAGNSDLRDYLRDVYAEQIGPQMGQLVGDRLAQPQRVSVGGKEYGCELRPERVYNSFALTLLKATHKVYPGSDIPKDFRSRVQLENAQTGENREVEIYMNQPLRYAGLTLYQYQMNASQVARRAGQRAYSVLMVVRNPSWLTPYFGCILVGTGLVIQFTMHLVGFISKRKAR